MSIKSKFGGAIGWAFHKAQKHYLSFRFLVWLREHGITRKVGCRVMSGDDVTFGRPEEDIQRSKEFFSDPVNVERMKKMLALLADEKSKIVWGGVIRHRAEGTPIEPEWYSDNDQYFAKDVIHFEDGEVFIDGGGYTGDTVQQFMDLAKKAKVRYKRIIVFEPDERNCALIRKFHGRRRDVVIVPKGLSDSEKVLVFGGEGATFALADENAPDVVKVPVINIDAMPECQDATWIKMDIEGSEMDALRGGRNVIQRNHPKLTICIYHSDEDMIRIAEYIHELVPEYKLYVRHHKKNYQETVLYAIP